MKYNLNNIKVRDSDYIFNLCLKHDVNNQNDVFFIEEFLNKNVPKYHNFYKYNIFDKVYLENMIKDIDYKIIKEQVVNNTDFLDFIREGKDMKISTKNITYLSPPGILKYYKMTKLKTSLYSKLLIYCLENTN
tara:strand:- start:1043 stop:1441 length:399 start_codon:yes stop_codon:yes gene_type:complete